MPVAPVKVVAGMLAGAMAALVPVRANLQAAVIWVAVMVSRVFRIAAPAWVMLLSVPSVMRLSMRNWL